MKTKTYSLANKFVLAMVGIAAFTSFQEIKCFPSPQRRRGNNQGYGKYDEKAFQEQIKADYQSKSSSKLFAKRNWHSAIAFGPGSNISSEVSVEVSTLLY